MNEHNPILHRQQATVEACQLTQAEALSPLNIHPTVSGRQQPPDGAQRLFAGLNHGKNTDEPAQNVEQSIQKEGAADAEMGEQPREGEAHKEVQRPAQGTAHRLRP